MSLHAVSFRPLPKKDHRREAAGRTTGGLGAARKVNGRAVKTLESGYDSSMIGGDDGVGLDGGRSGMPGWVKGLLFALVSLAALAMDGWWIKARWDAGKDVGIHFFLGIILLVCVYGGLTTFVKRLAFEAGDLDVKPLRVGPGGEVTVVYRQFVRRSVRIPKASIRLVFTEKAVSGSGKSRTHHEKETIVQSVDRESIDCEPGQELLLSARLVVPADAMHQFSAGSNDLEWTVVVAAQVQGWPDIEEKADLEVAPPGRPAGDPEDA